ncbi:hypothetical protein QSH57_000004 [Fusarium oxysporum f. sp. vasinfectum]|nr:hypothetical protein QSH57_000004 [Fusarium oxysporum f. sp. vasinfectum]
MTDCSPQEEAFLEVLYPENDTMSTPALDIVAVHGFGADPYWTWTRGHKHFLKDSDMLPHFFPNARIMVFGYRSESPTAKTVNHQIAILAVQLLQLVRDNRSGTHTQPLIFIGHSFGGNIIEEAIVDAAREEQRNRELLASIAGIIFLGTPHRTPASQPQILAIPSLLSFLGHGGSSLFLRLKRGPGISESLLFRFKEVAHLYSILLFCFYELEMADLSLIMRSHGWHLPPYYCLVVDMHSATIDDDMASKEGLKKNHFSLNKFASSQDSDFKNIIRVIDRFYCRYIERESNDRD